MHGNGEAPRPASPKASQNQVGNCAMQNNTTPLSLDFTTVHFFLLNGYMELNRDR